MLMDEKGTVEDILKTVEDGEDMEKMKKRWKEMEI